MEGQLRQKPQFVIVVIENSRKRKIFCQKCGSASVVNKPFCRRQFLTLSNSKHLTGSTRKLVFRVTMWQGRQEISVKTVFYHRFYDLFPYSSITPVTINLLCVCDILCHICEVQNICYISQCQFYSPGKGNNAVDTTEHYYLLPLKMFIKTRGGEFVLRNICQISLQKGKRLESLQTESTVLLAS